MDYAAFSREQEVEWSCVDPADPIFQFRWHAGEVVGLAFKGEHEHKLEHDGRFVYHERLLPSIAVRI